MLSAAMILAVTASAGPQLEARERSIAVDAQALEQFIDGVMQRAIVGQETVGATVALVKNGHLVTARGYGQADVTRNVPVDAQTTQFRIGSITKVLVWMAVMQQVEAGRLDLDADVNTYLSDFRMSSEFTAPITLRHLMTHTPGLEDNPVNLFVSGPRQLGELGQTLASNVPRRVALPGSLVSYSNYGAALAGYLVSVVSGMSWDDYLEASILKPLGMSGTTTRQPLPPAIERTRARGYAPALGGPIEQGFTYVPMAPAGAGTATAVDMARLMAELLNPADSRVLSAASKAQLLAGAYVIDAQVNGMALGLYEMSLGGSRAVGHGGNTMLFNSMMILWPDADIGLFVSTNTIGSEHVAKMLVETVAERLGLSAQPPPLAEVTEGAQYSGWYITARRNHSNYSKLLGLLDTVKVAYDAQAHALNISASDGVHQYRQLRGDVFQQVDGHVRVVFADGPGGHRVLYRSDRPMVAYTPAHTAETTIFNGLLLLAWAVLALGVLLVWPVSSFTHRQHPVVPGQRPLFALCYGSCLLLVYFFLQMAEVSQGPYHLMLFGFAEIPPLLWYPAVFAVLVLVQLIYGIRVWITGFWWPSRRLHFTLFMAAQCGVVWWLWYWNLVPVVLLDYLK